MKKIVGEKDGSCTDMGVYVGYVTTQGETVSNIGGKNFVGCSD